MVNTVENNQLNTNWTDCISQTLSEQRLFEFIQLSCFFISLREISLHHFPIYKTLLLSSAKIAKFYSEKYSTLEQMMPRIFRKTKSTEIKNSDKG